MFLITKILDLAYVQTTCVVYRKISQTLSYLEYICSLSSPLRDHDDNNTNIIGVIMFIIRKCLKPLACSPSFWLNTIKLTIRMAVRWNAND